MPTCDQLGHEAVSFEVPHQSQQADLCTTDVAGRVNEQDAATHGS
jgi:hypothetical protein